MRCERRHRCLMVDFIQSVLTILAVLLAIADAQVKVLSPPQLVTRVREVSSDKSSFLSGATATFGAPSYGESFVGRLFYAASDSAHCQPDYQAQIATQLSISGTRPDGVPAPIRRGSNGEEKPDSSDTVGPRLRKVFLLDRGNCTFVRKVSVAENLGADAVLIRDYPTSPWSRQDLLSVIMADDGRGTSVHIPSVMITDQDGSVLQEFAGKPETLLQLQWTLPQKSVVTMDFWTESGSSAGQRFLRDFAPFALQFGPHLRFVPHYNVFSLSSSSRPGSFKRSTEGESVDSGTTVPAIPGLTDSASTLCLPDNPWICSNPPDVVKSGLTGREVLQEDARQLCLWETTAQSGADIPMSRFSSQWWDYINKFSEECPLDASAPKHFGKECSFSVMRTIPTVSESDVMACVKQNMTSLLEEERANHAWGNLALRINSAKFSGSLDPALVAKAVCSAFQTTPKACADILGSVSPGLDGSSGSLVQRSAGVTTLLISGVVVSAVVGVGIFLHQRHLKKTMRASLRHEVMLEVRSQLQDYHQLDERETVLSMRGGRSIGGGGGGSTGSGSNSSRTFYQNPPMMQRKPLISLNIADGRPPDSYSSSLSNHTRLDPI